MALKYETMTEEERRADRLDRYRWREGWERDTIERRFCYTTAAAVALAIEEQEDSVLKVVAADFAGKDAVLQGMRRTATDLKKVYLQLETASKHGFKIAEKFFDRKSSAGAHGRAGEAVEVDHQGGERGIQRKQGQKE